MTLVPMRGGAPTAREPQRGPRELITELAEGLRAVRGEGRIGERDLAACWDDELGGSPELHRHAAAMVLAWCDLLASVPGALTRRGLLDTLGADPRGMGESARQGGQLRLFDDLAAVLAERSIAVGPVSLAEPLNAEWWAVLDIAAELRRLWAHTHLGVGRDPERLRVVAMAAHALHAPDEVWPRIDALAGETTASGPSDTWEELVRHPERLDSDGLLMMIADRHLEHDQHIVEAQDRVHDLEAADPVVRRDLVDGWGDDAAPHLDAVEIETRYLRELITHQRRYTEGGTWTRLVHGSVIGELRAEGARLLAEWNVALGAARDRVAAARSARERDLARFLAAAARHRPGRPSDGDPELVRERTYAGIERTAAALGRRPHGRLHTRRWDVEPLPDRRDVRLPESDISLSHAIFVPDGRDLTYEQACQAVRTRVLERLSKARPRSLKITWIDPVGQGQSAGAVLDLIEHDKRWLDDQVWCEPDDISDALRRVTDRMVMVRQRHLRGTHDDLDAYNAEAGTLHEPYHLVVVTGFPHGFEQRTKARLLQILESGPALGVQLFMVTDSRVSAGLNPRPGPGGFLDLECVDTGREGEAWPSWRAFLDHDVVFGAHGASWVALQPFSAPHAYFARCSWEPFDDAGASAIVTGYARACLEADDVVVDSSSLVRAAEGGRSSASALEIPVGVRGRGAEVALGLGRGLEQNVLVGGLPGSGKSSLFHTLIVSAVQRYTPEELELYLLDFKQGVEFQPYADGALPHARVVAVQSEREFGLSVLRGLRHQIDVRAALFRGPDGAGADSLQDYRARTGRPLPRILLVIDEFQVIFADDDALAQECAGLLDQIVRQGRAFGVHTVLGTQTLRGQGLLGLLRGTLDQIAVRILLKSSEADARLFLGDDNPAGASLTRAGQAIYNADGGSKTGNVEFQVALTDDAHRDAVIADVRRRADAAGDGHLRPMIFDGTRPVDVREDAHVADLVAGRLPLDPLRLRVHLGLPVALDGARGVELRREPAAAHVLVVERDLLASSGALACGLVTATLSAPSSLRIVIVDGLAADGDVSRILPDVARVLPDAVCLHRRKLARALIEAVTEVRERLAHDQYQASTTVLVLPGLQRMRELTDDYDPDGGPSQDLQEILRDGSDVGVHVIASVDSVENLERRLGPGALAEFGVRLVGQCSTDASHRLVGAPVASGLRDGSMVLHQPDLGRTETVRPYPAPDPAWVAHVVRARG